MMDLGLSYRIIKALANNIKIGFNIELSKSCLSYEIEEYEKHGGKRDISKYKKMLKETPPN